MDLVVKASSRALENDLKRYLMDELSKLGYEDLGEGVEYKVDEEDKTIKEIKEDALLYILTEVKIGKEPF